MSATENHPTGRDWGHVEYECLGPGASLLDDMPGHVHINALRQVPGLARRTSFSTQDITVLRHTTLDATT